MEELLKNRIRFARRKLGMTQQELAERTGVSRQTINALEKGNYSPSALLALKLCRELDLRFEQLFFLS